MDGRQVSRASGATQRHVPPDDPGDEGEPDEDMEELHEQRDCHPA